MKHPKNLKHLLIILSCLFLVYSCSDGEDDSNSIDMPSDTVSSAPADEIIITGTMLADAQNGQPFVTGISNFTIASSDDSVAIIIATTDNKLYAIDMPSDSADATANTITSVTDIHTAIQAVYGSVPRFENMYVNPISQEVYILVSGAGAGNNAIMVVKNNGASITQLDLSAVDYVEMSYSGNFDRVADMTYGDGTLYVSLNDGADNNKAVAKISAPFTHNDTTSEKKTAMFKSNWGGSHMTTAPLDKIVYGNVGGSKRLMGVTECAPGYSFPTSDLSGAGTLDVTEYFYFPGDMPKKVFSVTTSDKTYLMLLHGFGNDVGRIDEKYLDGSRTDINANAKGTSGTFFWNLPASDITRYDDMAMIAYLSSSQFLAIDINNVLKPVNF
jgi:hypothetical protein